MNEYFEIGKGYHFNIAVSEDVPPIYHQEAIKAAKWHTHVASLERELAVFDTDFQPQTGEEVELVIQAFENEIELIKQALQAEIDKCDPKIAQYLYIVRREEVVYGSDDISFADELFDDEFFSVLNPL